MVILSGILILKDVSENLTNIWIQILIMILTVKRPQGVLFHYSTPKMFVRIHIFHQSLLHREKRIILLNGKEHSCLMFNNYEYKFSHLGRKVDLKKKMASTKTKQGKFKIIILFNLTFWKLVIPKCNWVYLMSWFQKISVVKISLLTILYPKQQKKLRITITSF